MAQMSDERFWVMMRVPFDLWEKFIERKKELPWYKYGIDDFVEHYDIRCIMHIVQNDQITRLGKRIRFHIVHKTTI